MLRALWFIVKLSLFVFAVIWLTNQPGKVDIAWQGYEIRTSVGFIAVVFAALLVLWTLVYGVWRSIVAVPAVFKRYRVTARREKGYRAVTEGFVAIAAGDGRTAQKYADRARQMIPDASLTRLLIAQTALMNGNAPKARREFTALLEDDSAAFFGVRGLLHETLSHGNYREALDLARKAEELQPKRLWVIRTLFDLETRNGEWRKADATLRKAEKLGIFDDAAAKRHRQALFTALADDAVHQGHLAQAIKAAARAFDLDPAFAPAAIRLARLYGETGKRRAALKTLLAAWKAQPHPDLADLWMKFMPPAKKPKSPYDAGKETLAWMRQLTAKNPDHRNSQRALGAAALQARLWREAREYLTRGTDYRTLAKLEREETRNDTKAREWLEIAAENPPEPKWICHACGSAALDWTALCRHCSAFNQQEWRTPSLDIHEPPRRVAGFDGGLIGAAGTVF